MKANRLPLLLSVPLALWLTLAFCQAQEHLRVRTSWGHQAKPGTPFYLEFKTNDLAIVSQAPQGFEAGDDFQGNVCRTRAGGGDIDAIDLELAYEPRTITTITNLQRIWSDLIAQSDRDTAHRLRQDPAYRPDARRLTFQMNPEGTRGFTLTIDQLLQGKEFRVPAFNMLVTVEPTGSFADGRQDSAAALSQPASGENVRVLDQVHEAAEATYEEFTARWADMGNPAYQNPAQTGPGHIVGLTWDSALYKFGVDRWAGVWNDYGNPDRFELKVQLGSERQPLTWKSQRLLEGLPLLTTEWASPDVQCAVEQFAYPLQGPPSERRGDIPMVLVEEITLRNNTAQTLTIPVKLNHRRLLSAASELTLVSQPDGSYIVQAGQTNLLLSIQTDAGQLRSRDLPAELAKSGSAWQAQELALAVQLPPQGTRRLLVKLPSPIQSSAERERLLSLDPTQARRETVQFWSQHLDHGAQLQVPERAVNELFRANLWHALTLPRRHGGQEPDVKIDLPYSNFAYDQRGTPWPVNQAVYVDYMLYDLRGYHAFAQEELRAIYRNNQEANGHVGGYANWVVYTPGMMYSTAKDFLLSGDRHGFETLLPQTLRALDWCLGQLSKSATDRGAGLVRGPLNDLTGDGVWAFNQAYVYAGLDLLAKALSEIEHSRAAECQAAAVALQATIERAFGQASVRSPLVQLRDRTWIPYVPCEALSSGRLMQQWYPTDVDTGATHLPRLGAIAADGDLSDWLLDDHEDNLYLHGWGMANEPVYNQQATAYLLRDDPKAVIRAFYSMMACAFSHSVFEPVEHRWTWGQFFGPPSTDGAWFELYRNMLVRELDDGTLFLLQATPRPWLAAGKQIQVRRAPTYFGEVSLLAQSDSTADRIQVEVEPPSRKAPKAMLIRMRHPQSRSIRSVQVNGQSWPQFDAAKEWVRIPAPERRPYTIVCEYR